MSSKNGQESRPNICLYISGIWRIEPDDTSGPLLVLDVSSLPLMAPADILLEHQIFLVASLLK